MARKTDIVDELSSFVKTPEPEEGMACDVKGDDQIVTSISRTIRTLDEALAAAKVDLAVWDVSRFTINKWDSIAKLRRGSGDRLQATQLFQVKCWLVRKVAKHVEDGLALLAKRMQKYSPKYVKLSTPAKIEDPHLLEVSINDIHFAKLAWGRETGTNYDLSIAESLYADAVKNLASKSAGFNIEKILLPVGNDFFHVDGPGNMTTNGTPQDTDGRYCKLFETGQMAVVKAIDYLQSIAPVEVIWVGGNHDRVSSWHLVHTLKAWFRNCSRVSINDEPTPRKYVLYGKTMIGFTHGDEESHNSLPGIMAGEQPKMWSSSKHREFHLGHFHKRKETRHVGGDTYDGVVVRTLAALCGRDAWHARKGYIGIRAADAFLYSKANGPAGYFIANVSVEKSVS